MIECEAEREKSFELASIAIAHGSSLPAKIAGSGPAAALPTMTKSWRNLSSVRPNEPAAGLAVAAMGSTDHAGRSRLERVSDPDG